MTIERERMTVGPTEDDARLVRIAFAGLVVPHGEPLAAATADLIRAVFHRPRRRRLPGAPLRPTAGAARGDRKTCDGVAP